MKLVRYSGGWFVTSDAIASVILDYAASLANNGRAAHLRVPVLNGTADDMVDVDMVIGPASQLLAEDYPFDHELTDGAFVDYLRDELAEAGRRGPA